jgi:hypothetical protein
MRSIVLPAGLAVPITDSHQGLSVRNVELVPKISVGTDHLTGGCQKLVSHGTLSAFHQSGILRNYGSRYLPLNLCFSKSIVLLALRHASHARSFLHIAAPRACKSPCAKDTFVCLNSNFPVRLRMITIPIALKWTRRAQNRTSSRRSSSFPKTASAELGVLAPENRRLGKEGIKTRHDWLPSMTLHSRNKSHHDRRTNHV